MPSHPISAFDARYTAVLVLKELARNAPTLFYVQISGFFDCVGEGIKDQNIAVRECTLEALRCALYLITQREHRMRHQWYHSVLQDASEPLVSYLTIAILSHLLY